MFEALRLKIYLLILLNLIDLGYVLACYKYCGAGVEWNPIARWIIETYGLATLVIFKDVLVGFFVVVMLIYAKDERKNVDRIMNSVICVHLVAMGIIVHNLV